MLTVPLFLRSELNALLVVGSADKLPRSACDALEALSSQVALALESAALTEDLLRQQSEARFSSLVQNSSDVIMVVDADSTIRYMSPSVDRVIGYPATELEGTRLIDLINAEDKTRVLQFLTTGAREHDDHPARTEFRLRHQHDFWLHAEAVRTNLLHDENVRGIVLNIRDVSERKAFEEQLAHQAFHDSVTGLANRALFKDRVEHALERQARGSRPVSVLFMDLDDFKTINDSLGHAAGDLVLGEVGERLKTLLAGGRHRRPPRRRRVRDPARGLHRRDRSNRGRGADPHRPRRRVPAREQRGVRPRVASASRTPTTRADPVRKGPKSCCATRTSRCTWRRKRARVATRCSNRRCTTPRCAGSS